MFYSRDLPQRVYLKLQRWCLPAHCKTVLYPPEHVHLIWDHHLTVSWFTRTRRQQENNINIYFMLSNGTCVIKTGECRLQPGPWWILSDLTLDEYSRHAHATFTNTYAHKLNDLSLLLLMLSYCSPLRRRPTETQAPLHLTPPSCCYSWRTSFSPPWSRSSMSQRTHRSTGDESSTHRLSDFVFCFCFSSCLWHR